MFSIIDAAILVGLAIELGLIGLVIARGTWRKLSGKLLLVLSCAALAATLVPAARRANAHWRVRDVKAFVRTSIEQLNAGHLPDLSHKCTKRVVKDIEALKGAGLPVDYTVAKVEFADDYYALDLRTKQGEAFWCMVEATAPSSRLLAPGQYKVLELAPPESLARPAPTTSERGAEE